MRGDRLQRDQAAGEEHGPEEARGRAGEVLGDLLQGQGAVPAATVPHTKRHLTVRARAERPCRHGILLAFADIDF